VRKEGGKEERKDLLIHCKEEWGGVMCFDREAQYLYLFVHCLEKRTFFITHPTSPRKRLRLWRTAFCLGGGGKKKKTRSGHESSHFKPKGDVSCTIEKGSYRARGRERGDGEPDLESRSEAEITTHGKTFFVVL